VRLAANGDQSGEAVFFAVGRILFLVEEAPPFILSPPSKSINFPFVGQTLARPRQRLDCQRGKKVSRPALD